jgi:hypothetical protein
MFDANPSLACLRMAEVLGTIMAGALCESCEPYGKDLEAIQQWQEAYMRCGADLSDWLKLKASAQDALSRWAHKPGVIRAIASMADMLVHVGEVGREAFENVLAAICVTHLPLLVYTVTLPSAKRWPNNRGAAVHMPAQPRGAERVSVARPVERVTASSMYTTDEAEDRARFFRQLDADRQEAAKHYKGMTWHRSR